jgi:hypothetical protein
MTLSKYRAFMAYIEPTELVRLKKFARKKKTTMAGVLREALSSRLAEGDPYMAGFNAGLKRAIEVTEITTGAQMRFPSGKSFAELVAEEIEKHYIKDEQNVN